jgi:hypothetical protein
MLGASTATQQSDSKDSRDGMNPSVQEGMLRIISDAL